VLNSRIQELENTNGEQLKKIRDLQESTNNNHGINFGAEISGVPDSVVEGLKIEELKMKNGTLMELNVTLKNTTDKLRTQNDQLLIDVGHLKVEFDTADREREAFRKQLHEIANFGNSEDEGTDVLRFFHEINGLKRENTDLMARNDQLEEEIEQLLKQRTVNHKVQGVLPDESVGPQEGMVNEVIFGVQAGNVESSNESPYESHWTAGIHTQKIRSLEQDNEVLQLKVKELSDQKMELESNAEDVYEEISRNEAQISKLQKTNKHLEMECDSLEKQCEILQLESKRYKLEISGMKKSVDVVDAQGVEMKRLEDECDKLQDSLEAVTFVLDETKRHVEILAKENEVYKTNVASLEAENVSTCDSLRSEAAEEREKLSNQIDILQKEKDTYQEQLDELNNSLRKKNNRISSLVQTIEELKRGSIMLHSSKNDIEDQMGTMRCEIETLKYENEELEKTVDRLMKRGSEEESIKLSIAKSTSPLSADDGTVSQLEKEVVRLKKQVKKLVEDNKEYQEEINEFSATNQSNFEQCTQLCDELGTVKEEYDELEDQKLTLEEHFRQSEEERDRMQAEISIKKKKINELKAQCQELTERNQELTGVISSLKEECLQLEVDKDKLAQKVQSHQANFDITVKDNLALAAVPKVGESGEVEDEEVHQLREECSDLLQLNSDLRVRAQSVTKVQEELFELQEDNDRLTGEIENSAKEVAALSLENRSLKEKCENLEHNSAPVSGEQEKEELELQHAVQNLQDKIVILQHEMNILTKSNSRLTAECEAYVSQTESLEDERDTVVKERETILRLNETLRCQLEELERENLEFEKERLRHSDYDKLKENISVLGKENDYLQAQVKDSRHLETETTQLKIEELERENLELEKERLRHSDYDKLRENISVLGKEKDSLQVQVKDLKHLETETTQLKIDLHEVKSGRLQSDRKVKDLLMQNEELRTDVGKLSQIANSRVPEEQTSEQVKQAVQDAERKIKKLQEELRRHKKHYKVG
jgi:chromosome segregation ATPase